MSQQAQQSGPVAPDSPVLVVTSNVQKYAIKKKKVLSAEESELFELTQAAGITVDQEVFKIMVDLLKMNVAPQAVFQTLKAMCAGQRVAESCGESSSAPHTTSGTTAPTEVKDEESLVSGKSPKLAAAHHSASAPRSARVSTKIVVYGPQDASSPHSQAARTKAGASQSEKSREPSSQKAQRQPSATRGQKTKSSGSSSSSSQINSS
ncbi:mitotic-spindle organizing protein 2 isoform X1 [Fundulus heteroclitus]|uniref:mitotic-spindle organizing protein 2 isoform X1 n=1 Tax=Fundulus heteroclitus TaxID=8078 RepID=UPI00165BD06F|nr:mitotic-spindle organizing protein 2 isoform X1 [Fundulus heteroclitus]XP_021175731.2 mitotic-spindle organizing protein 2 isoform X1 [Fundulus heteroclitus]